MFFCFRLVSVFGYERFERIKIKLGLNIEYSEFARRAKIASGPLISRNGFRR